jgi:hypothetical protein
MPAVSWNNMGRNSVSGEKGGGPVRIPGIVSIQSVSLVGQKVTLQWVVDTHGLLEQEVAEMTVHEAIKAEECKESAYEGVRQFRHDMKPQDPKGLMSAGAVRTKGHAV